jgi:hypothetical protein
MRTRRLLAACLSGGRDEKGGVSYSPGVLLGDKPPRIIMEIDPRAAELDREDTPSNAVSWK